MSLLRHIWGVKSIKKDSIYFEMFDIGAEYFQGAHFYSGDVKDHNIQNFHQQHHFYATTLARRCQNGF